MAIEFFGDVDKTSTGSIASEWPAWFHDVHLEKMEEEVASKKRMLKQGRIPQENIFMVMNEVSANEQKIKEIKNSMPKLKGAEQDKVHNEYLLIGQQIAESMPTRRDELNGFANPREEMFKNQTPGIKMSPEMAASIGVKLVKGKVTLKQAQKFYRMAGKALGENSNIERLRREGKSESYRTMEDLTRKVLEQIAMKG